MKRETVRSQGDRAMPALKGLIGLTGLLCYSGDVVPAAGEPGGSESPPNIIYIMADDLGHREVGAYGQEKIRTPHIDQLAKEGMRFTDHYSAAPVCAPARCGLMTGRHMGNAAIRNNKEVQPWGQHPLPADQTTVAELLQEAGYQTAAVGKWGLGPQGSEGDPNRQGFDLFFGYNCQRQAHTYYPTHLWRNDRRVNLIPFNGEFPRNERGFLESQEFDEIPGDPQGFFDRYRGEAYATDLMIREAERFIRENRDEPFFLYYGTPVPHVALQVPEDSLMDYLGLGWDEEPYLGNAGYLPHPAPRAGYAAMITRFDRNVGRLVDLVDELGLAENTVIMVTSDNGTTSAGGVEPEFFNSVGPLRGLKGSLFEGGIRVPMVARWPGRIEAGSVTALPSYFPDVMPTLLELAGREDLVPESTDGISFAPTLLGDRDRQEKHDYLYWEYSSRGGWQAVRMGDWKAVRRNLRGGTVETELYNLADDIGEQRGVAGEHPDIVERAEELLDQARTPSELFPMAAID